MNILKFVSSTLLSTMLLTGVLFTTQCNKDKDSSNKPAVTENKPAVTDKKGEGGSSSDKPVAVADKKDAPDGNTNVSAPGTPASAEKARKLIETGLGGKSDAMIEQIISTYKTMAPQIPAEFWEEVKKEFTTQELIEKMIPVYAKHFTDQEIDEIMACDKEAGKAGCDVVAKKAEAKLTPIIQELAPISMEWGKQIGMRVVAKMKAKGYNLPQAPAPQPN